MFKTWLLKIAKVMKPSSMRRSSMPMWLWVLARGILPVFFIAMLLWVPSWITRPPDRLLTLMELDQLFPQTHTTAIQSLYATADPTYCFTPEGNPPCQTFQGASRYFFQEYLSGPNPPRSPL